MGRMKKPPDVNNSRYASLPEVEFTGKLFCPHCGIRLFSWDNGTISKCPHLVFAYGWNDPDIFLAARPDFARSFFTAMMTSPVYRELLAEDELDPIITEEIEVFVSGEFSPGDELSCKVASYCWDLPERLFPELLVPSTIIFKDDRYHSGIHIAVDMGDYE